jgi:hypothetical protein
MQYALLIYSRPGAQDGHTDEQRQAVTAEYLAIADDPRMIGSAHLAPADSATTVRVQDGRPLITDGPFADTKEVFAGFFVIEADDIEAALEVAERIPASRLGGAIEVRPLARPLR